MFTNKYLKAFLTPQMYCFLVLLGTIFIGLFRNNPEQPALTGTTRSSLLFYRFVTTRGISRVISGYPRYQTHPRGILVIHLNICSSSPSGSDDSNTTSSIVLFFALCVYVVAFLLVCNSNFLKFWTHSAHFPTAL